MKLRVDRVPNDEVSFSNCAAVSYQDFQNQATKYVKVQSGPRRVVIFTIKRCDEMKPGTIGFNQAQRKWGDLGAGMEVEVTEHNFSSSEYIIEVTADVDFISKKSATSDKPFDTDLMAKEFCMQYQNQSLQPTENVFFKFDEYKLLVVIKEIQGGDIKGFMGGKAKSKVLNSGVFLPNASISFDRSPDSQIILTGKSKGKGSQHKSIINPDWDFQKMGIGGLDDEFSGIFRRAFASRVFPPEIVQQLGHKHVRGILLYGPPGTGKTLMARQIGKMLNSREPKIINGPEILNKFVGQSEENVRKLFEDAEEEQKRCGINSGLHIIIFDEIDAICKERGSVGGGTGVHDTVVNQLLSKMDGVNQLNNILVIGMTNRKDLIDDALLRPGRLEVQTEIHLPSEKGRHQIFEIYVTRMRDFGKLDTDVNTQELAALTKNFSGAEIEGLVRAAQATALNRLIKGGAGGGGVTEKDKKKSSKIELDQDAADKIKICRDDFMHALDKDIKPAFGYNTDTLNECITNGIIHWGHSVDHLLEDGRRMIQQTKNSEMTPVVTFLIEGPPNCGKTALAAHLALQSDFPFCKVISPANFIGMSEMGKCQAIKKMFFDSYKSQLSCLVIDEIEALLEYVPIGPRFSNMVLQALSALVKKTPPKGNRLLIIGTTSRRDVLDEMGLLSAFNATLHLSNITRGEEVVTVLQDMRTFSNDEIDSIKKKISSLPCFVGIKKLMVLAEAACQASTDRVNTFICLLEDEGGVYKSPRMEETPKTESVKSNDDRKAYKAETPKTENVKSNDDRKANKPPDVVKSPKPKERLSKEKP